MTSLLLVLAAMNSQTKMTISDWHSPLGQIYCHGEMVYSEPSAPCDVHFEVKTQDILNSVSRLDRTESCSLRVFGYYASSLSVVYDCSTRGRMGDRYREFDLSAWFKSTRQVDQFMSSYRGSDGDYSHLKSILQHFADLNPTDIVLSKRASNRFRDSAKNDAHGYALHSQSEADFLKSALKSRRALIKRLKVATSPRVANLPGVDNRKAVSDLKETDLEVTAIKKRLRELGVTP